MGRFHVTIETTARDILKVLERRRVHPGVTEEVKAKLDKLIRLSLRQDRDVRESQDSIPAAIIVRDIVTDVIDYVCDTKLPFVEQEKAQRALAANRQEVYELRELLFERELLENIEGGNAERLQRHHDAFMATMFREVRTLRQTIQSLEERLARQQQEPVTAGVSPLERPASPPPASSPPKRRAVTLDGSDRCTTPGLSTVASMATLTRSGTGAIGATPERPGTGQQSNPMALFDYELYMKDFAKHQASWPLRYAELEKKLQDFVADANRNSADMAVNYQQSMRRKDQSIAIRDRQVKQLKDVINTFYPRVMNALRTVQSDFEEHVAAVRRDANQQREVMMEWFKKLKRHLAGIDDRFEVFVSFTVHAFGHLAKQVDHLAKRNGSPMPWSAPLWHFFLLQGATDRLEEGKVFWQNHEKTKEMVNNCRTISTALEAIMGGLEPADEFDELIRAIDGGAGGRGVTPTTAVAGVPAALSKPSSSPVAKSLTKSHMGSKGGRAASSNAAAVLSQGRTPQASSSTATTPRAANRSSRVPTTHAGMEEGAGSAYAFTDGDSNRVLRSGKSVVSDESLRDDRSDPGTQVAMRSAAVGQELLSGGFVLGRPLEAMEADASGSQQPTAVPRQRLASTTPMQPRAPSVASTSRTRTTTPKQSSVTPSKRDVRPPAPPGATTPGEAPSFDVGTPPSPSQMAIGASTPLTPRPHTALSGKDDVPVLPPMARKASTRALEQKSNEKRPPFLGSPTVQASFKSAASKMSPKEIKLREKLLNHADRVNRAVVMGILGRVTLRARRSAFFKSLSTAAKNAYMTLSFMDSELTRLNEQVVGGRARRIAFEEQVLMLDEAAKSNADAAARAQALAEINKAMLANVKADAKLKSGADSRKPKQSFAGVDDDANLRHNEDEEDPDDMEARLASAVKGLGAHDAARIGGAASLKAGEGRFDEDLDAEGLHIHSAVPPSEVYIPTPGHVISSQVAAQSRDLLVRRGLSRTATRGIAM